MRKYLFLLFAILSALVLIGCGSTRQVAVVDHIKQDTLYLNRIQYDSIFVSQQHSSDYHLNPFNPLKQSETDTLFIRDVSVEYRYRLLRDTVRIHQVDSIPVIKEVEITKEVRYIPWWSKALNWIGAISLLLIILYIAFRILRLYLKL